MRSSDQTTTPDRAASPPGCALGGAVWVLIAALASVLGVLAWRLPAWFGGSGPTWSEPPWNGFSLRPGRASEEQLYVAARRDALKPLLATEFLSPAQIDELNTGWRKYLTDGDRVVGLRLGEVTRAYPLSMLEWHEVVEDEAGAQPFMVTYHPVCDSVAVYSRRIEGKERHFGLSGLFFQSNHLVYEKGAHAEAMTLYSQLDGQAVAGARAGSSFTLEALAFRVCSWHDWRSEYPSTQVLGPHETLREMHRKRWRPYSSYRGSDLLRFPVAPLPAHEEMPYKTPCLIVQAGAQRRVYPVPRLASRADSKGMVGDTLGGVELRFTLSGKPAQAWVQAEDATQTIIVRYASRFAWYARYPSDDTFPAP